MSASVHLLFLLSLAVFSWAILCYFKEVEKRLMCSSTNEFQEPVIDASELAGRQDHVPDYLAYRCRENYDLYVNFICIVACIYALGRIAHIAERYLARQMYGKFIIHKQRKRNCPTRVDHYNDCMENCDDLLRWQIDALEKKNEALEDELNRSITEKAQEDPPVAFPPTKSLMQSIYISNRHVHLDRNVYLNSNAIVKKFHTCSEELKNLNYVWENYLEMQNGSPSKRPDMWANIKRESTYVPVVLSTEDLQKYHGLM